MYCTKCGAKIEEGTKFCPQCGAPVTGSEKKSETGANKSTAASSTKGGNPKVFAAAAALIILCVITLPKLFGGSKKASSASEAKLTTISEAFTENTAIDENASVQETVSLSDGASSQSESVDSISSTADFTAYAVTDSEASGTTPDNAEYNDSTGEEIVDEHETASDLDAATIAAYANFETVLNSQEDDVSYLQTYQRLINVIRVNQTAQYDNTCFGLYYIDADAIPELIIGTNEQYAGLSLDSDAYEAAYIGFTVRDGKVVQFLNATAQQSYYFYLIPYENYFYIGFNACICKLGNNSSEAEFIKERDAYSSDPVDHLPFAATGLNTAPSETRIMFLTLQGMLNCMDISEDYEPTEYILRSWDDKDEYDALRAEFLETYADVWENIPTLIADYSSQSDSEEGETEYSMDDLLEIGEDLNEAYQTFSNEFPGAADAVAVEAGLELGTNYLEFSAIRGVTNYLLGDSETASDLRSAAFGVLYALAMNALENRPKTAPSNSLYPVAVSENYALVTTLGGMESALKAYRTLEGYTLVSDALNEQIDRAPYASATASAMYAALGVYEYRWSVQKKAYLATADGIELNRRLLYCNEYFIIDKDDHVCASFFLGDKNADSEPDYASINDYGDISLAADGDSGCIILDKDGNVLFESTVDEAAVNNVCYFSVNPSRNVLRLTSGSSFEDGDYNVLELVHADGAADEIIKARNINVHNPYESKDYYYVDYQPLGSDTKEEKYIDMATGELITENEYLSIRNNSQEETEQTLPDWANALEKAAVVNDEYIMDYDHNKLCTYAGEEVADLSAGHGVEELYYNEDLDSYWIVTWSGYFYILDKNMQKTFEPIQIGQDVEYEFSQYGLFADSKDEEEAMLLYDSTGKDVLRFPGLEISTGWFSKDWRDTDWICGSKYIGWVNLHTQEYLYMSFGTENSVRILLPG